MTEIKAQTGVVAFVACPGAIVRFGEQKQLPKIQGMEENFFFFKDNDEFIGSFYHSNKSTSL